MKISSDSKPVAPGLGDAAGTSALAEGEGLYAAPALSLPKGGGALRGIGEKSSVNPVTGTFAFTLPILLSPGRSGFDPHLSLNYDSASGNGPFGFGWKLSLPAVTRKTDKGLPLYHDGDDSDVFLLSGSEDLVPIPSFAGSNPRVLDGKSYRIRRYRPRIEGLFARIERWSNENDAADVFWRTISAGNVTTWYGKNADSRIDDPEDRSRIFSWLICESYDDKGNAVIYEYQEENSDRVDLSQLHERNRDAKSRSANRYPKSIRYGNRRPYFPKLNETGGPTPLPEEWLFEAVFDYGEHDADAPEPGDAGLWLCRQDPFSTCRAGFEIRTYRICQRVLMFHHFPNEPEIGADCLVRSTDFQYSDEADPGNARNPIFSSLRAVTQSGYRREPGGGYLKRSFPPVEFEYSEPVLDDQVRELDAASLDNLPAGVDEGAFRWVDLDGEGLPGVLSEQAGAWYYKRNLSPLNLIGEAEENRVEAKLGMMERIAERPSTAVFSNSGGRFLDLAGDGRLDWVEFASAAPGFFERSSEERWEAKKNFALLPIIDWSDPNLKFVDLTGDGLADIFVTEDTVFRWHPSLGENGFDSERLIAGVKDEERGPLAVFADGTETLFLADMSGDGLADLVRIRSGEVCYWPSQGHGRFGAKISMDRAPSFDSPDRFDPRRIVLADVDGSGLTDILYLGANDTRVYFNQSGNAWSAAEPMVFPPVDENSRVSALDLLGNGTACLLWSSSLLDSTRPCLKYLDLMSGKKPHLLVSSRNNLGAETRIHYAPSTRFYLADKLAGRPWVTKLPFPVQVVERLETWDLVSQNRFVVRYAYHHGYFDPSEREFRGFGMVEQWDTEEFASLRAQGGIPDASNLDAVSHVPPALTKAWFHTGAYLEEGDIGLAYAREYYGAPQPDAPNYPAAFAAYLRSLLPDTILPSGLSAEEEREACRALKGCLLRQEIYAQDGTGKSRHPYAVAERSYAVRREQARAERGYGVFSVHSRESLSINYEREPTDPRISHALTLEVDPFGNALKTASIQYGRRNPDAELGETWDRGKQGQTWITYTENRMTNDWEEDDTHRTPLLGETRSYELTGYAPGAPPRFTFDDFITVTAGVVTLNVDGELDYEVAPAGGRERRLIAETRTYYRPDDLGTSTGDFLALLPLGQTGKLALPGRNFHLAFTPGLLTKVLNRQLPGRPAENLLSDPVAMLRDQGGYVDLDGDDQWWRPSGRIFFHPDSAQEAAAAPEHFYLPRRFENAFGKNSLVRYDAYDLLVQETEDALGNRISAGSRAADGSITPEIDYRVLQAALLTDPNGAISEIQFDALGMVVATAISKDGEGGSLDNTSPDLSPQQVEDFFQDPRGQAVTLLGDASTRMVYDLERFQRVGEAVFSATMIRESHASAGIPAGGLKTQVQIFYSDGFGRLIQKKVQAEAGPLSPGAAPVDPRWVGSGWTIFNNKGLAVRKYEPFFSDSHLFEFAMQQGVSATLFYDPLGRVVGTLHPNHTYEKTAFTPWMRRIWDVNDTSREDDPRNDPHLGAFFQRLPQASFFPTWYSLREGGGLGLREQDAAEKTAAHRDTPSEEWFDALGRVFLRITSNRFPSGAADLEELYRLRSDLDVEGHAREVFDAMIDPVLNPLGRSVVRYDFDMLGRELHRAAMDSGDRWALLDVAGQPIFGWDGLGRNFRKEYDDAHRPLRSYVRGALPLQPNREILAERIVYGEDPANGLTPAQVMQGNLRGKVYQAFDGSGLVTNERFDFVGNRIKTRRRLAAEYRNPPDWSALPAPVLETQEYVSQVEYDALNRPLASTPPDGSVLRPSYNESGLMESITVTRPGGPIQTFVSNIEYDAQGRRTAIRYGNGVETLYFHDPLTFRLQRLQSTRDTGAETLQDFRYSYDAVGNLVHVVDDVQQTLYFNNRRVDPDRDYSYDAVYRLIRAEGREHLGQVGAGNGPPRAPRSASVFSAPLPNPGDGNAMGRYAEDYRYDAAGNLFELKHRGTSPAHPGWSQSGYFDEGNNRLTRSELAPSGQTPVVETFSYDRHGNMTGMPHLTQMSWDYRDQLQATSRQAIGGGAFPETTFYVYDAAGTRVRKLTEGQAAAGATPRRRKERIYLGALEIYREYAGDGVTVTLERETLHVMDDSKRVAMIENKTVDAGAPAGLPTSVIRYQLANHLAGSGLETDSAAQIITYEEYFPYGGTSYEGARAGIEVSLKRYRYCGKERDEENGFYYYGLRYYSPWLLRWISSDPAGIADGPNPYLFAGANPVTFSDANGLGKGPESNPTATSPLDPEPVPKSSVDYKGGVPTKKVSDAEWSNARRQQTEAASQAKGAESFGGQRQQHHTADVDASKQAKLDPKVAGEPERLVTVGSRRQGMPTGTINGEEFTHHNVMAKTGKEVQATIAQKNTELKSLGLKPAPPEAAVVDASAETVWRFRGTGIDPREPVPIERGPNGQATKWGPAEENPMPRPIVEVEPTPFDAEKAAKAPGTKAAIEANAKQSKAMGTDKMKGFEEWNGGGAKAKGPGLKPGSGGGKMGGGSGGGRVNMNIVVAIAQALEPLLKKHVVEEISQKPIDELTAGDYAWMDYAGYELAQTIFTESGYEWYRPKDQIKPEDMTFLDKVGGFFEGDMRFIMD